MAKEINLVPDVKNEFIKTLKFRNFVFFLCIIIASSSVVVILIFLSIAGGQQGFITAKQNTLKSLEQKIGDYSDLSEFLTIRDQLGNIAKITESKVMMSRTFNVLSAIIPSPNASDRISISELAVDLSGEAPTFTFDAQADAGPESDIDYKVLDSFKKSMAYMRYDYGEYVDKKGNIIPAYCMIESDQEGATLKDADKGYYAYWLIEGEGCNPAATDAEDTEEVEETKDVEEFEDDKEENEESTESTEKTEEQPAPEPTLEELSKKFGYTVEKWNGQNVVKIWRTPQFADWYKENEKESYMELDGTIKGIPHFDSSCIKYSGEKKESDNITWSITNDTCKLVPDSDEEGNGGIKINDSSNGRDSEEKLVLRFSAIIAFAPEVFNFDNHHMLALSPAGRRNVTDSYAQIQSMFVERATDCQKDDIVCIETPTSDNNNNEQEDEDDQENDEEKEW